MKFVKGDAIAGIIMILINIIAGLIIGVVMKGMSPIEAVQKYTILTIGEGLVAQIPALLITVTAGMVVTRLDPKKRTPTWARTSADRSWRNPRPSGLRWILAASGLIPGLPHIPFLILAAVISGVAYQLYKTVAKKEEEAKAAAVPSKPGSITPRQEAGRSRRGCGGGGDGVGAADAREPGALPGSLCLHRNRWQIHERSAAANEAIAVSWISGSAFPECARAPRCRNSSRASF